MRDIIDKSIVLARFSMNDVYEFVFSQPQYKAYHDKLITTFPKELQSILRALIRFAFYIEPVKQPTIDSTKFSVRWNSRLNDDPRFCSYETCVAIFDKLLSDLVEVVSENSKVDTLKLVVSHSLVPYEINIDYKERMTENIHSVENISFFWDEEARQTYLLRKYLLNPKNHGYIDFFSETYRKIATKSFLTDRVLTGDYKTNREKRWECHPGSVHFALRKECLAIELKLVGQICHFEGFPRDLRELLTKENVVTFTDDVTKCPITLEPILFTNFNQEVLNPTHGKATVQVGHIHPLKAVGENITSGHTADNISWISSVGNRIQGELSVDETRELIFRIIANYKNAGLID